VVCGVLRHLEVDLLIHGLINTNVFFSEGETAAVNTRTTIDVTVVGFNRGPSDDLCTQRSLERGRQ